MHSCAFSLVLNQALFVLLAYTFVQAHFMLCKREELNRGGWARARLLLSPTFEAVAVYFRQRFCLLARAEYGRILLDTQEPARGKLRDRLTRGRLSSCLAIQLKVHFQKQILECAE